MSTSGTTVTAQGTTDTADAARASGRDGPGRLRVAVVGAGVAGLATAAVLREHGHEVLVLDRTPDVGGVWSATRRYPGVGTQNSKGTYAFSDLPMPRDYPEWPSGEQVQAYLATYATRAGLEDCLRLGTEVVSAEPASPGWRLRLRGLGAGGADGAEVLVDHLVVANGVFSDPRVPDLPGRAEHAAAGGRLVAPGAVHGAEEARGAHVVVLGYGR